MHAYSEKTVVLEERMLSRSLLQQRTEEKEEERKSSIPQKADQRRTRKESPGEKRVQSWRLSSGCRKKLTEERKCSGRSQRLITWEEPERKLQRISKVDQRRTRKEISADFRGWSEKCREEKKEKRWENRKVCSPIYSCLDSRLVTMQVTSRAHLLEKALCPKLVGT